MGWGMGRTGRDHARFAERDPMPGKSSRAPPRTPLGPEGPRPHQWVHRTPDTAQPGQLRKNKRGLGQEQWVRGGYACAVVSIATK